MSLSFFSAALSEFQCGASFVDLLSVGLDCHVRAGLVGGLERAIDSIEGSAINGVSFLGLGEVCCDTFSICAASLASLVGSGGSVFEEIIMNGLDDQFMVLCSLSNFRGSSYRYYAGYFCDLSVCTLGCKCDPKMFRLNTCKLSRISQEFPMLIFSCLKCLH